MDLLQPLRPKGSAPPPPPAVQALQSASAGTEGRFRVVNSLYLPVDRFEVVQQAGIWCSGAQQLQ